jgi:hypothetical protein
MDTPLSSQMPPSTSPLESHCGPPFSPMVWCGLTSIVHKPQRWQVVSSTPSKTTKMLLRFRHPSTTEKRSHASSQMASESSKPSLPKGWVYAPEEVEVKVEAEVIDPSQYQMLDAPRRSKRKALGPPEESHPQSRRASNTIEAQPSYLSESGTSMAVKRLRVTSVPILTPLTLL